MEQTIDMHPRVMVERTASAQKRIATAAQRIGARLELDERVAALANANNRDAEVAILQQREAIADLLEAVAEKLDASLLGDVTTEKEIRKRSKV